MNIVLLSGGSGQRLWPLSNDIRSKQFIKIFHTADGELESMVQRVYRQIRTIDKDATVTIATSKSQVSAIHNQLGEDVGISVEPCRRDTFPAIALAAAYLKDIKGISEDEPVVVCPVDPYVEIDYFDALKDLGAQAASSNANLVLMGIEPTYPSEKYGYIIPDTPAPVSTVSMFKEKPTKEIAEQYISQGALWNGGVFAFRLGYVLDRAHALIDFENYEDRSWVTSSGVVAATGSCSSVLSSSFSGDDCPGSVCSCFSVFDFPASGITVGSSFSGAFVSEV